MTKNLTPSHLRCGGGAKRLRDLGTQSLYTNDASMRLAESTLDLVIELIEAIADVAGRADETAPRNGRRRPYGRGRGFR